MSIVLGLVTIFILMAISVGHDWAVDRRRARAVHPDTALRAMRVPNPPFGLFLDDGHSWVRLASDGTLRVGLDDFLTEALGRVRAVLLPSEGRVVRRGEPLVQLQVGARTLTVPAPTDGEIVAVNRDLARDPRPLDTDPYGLGWIASLRTRDLQAAVAPLHLGQGGNGFLQAELRRFIDLLTTNGRDAAPSHSELGLVLADGGLPQFGILANCPEETFQKFEATFMQVRSPATEASRE